MCVIKCFSEGRIEKSGRRGLPQPDCGFQIESLALTMKVVYCGSNSCSIAQFVIFCNCRSCKEKY